MLGHVVPDRRNRQSDRDQCQNRQSDRDQCRIRGHDPSDKDLCHDQSDRGHVDSGLWVMDSEVELAVCNKSREMNENMVKSKDSLQAQDEEQEQDRR